MAAGGGRRAVEYDLKGSRQHAGPDLTKRCCSPAGCFSLVPIVPNIENVRDEG
jgi:hypothetical protein